MTCVDSDFSVTILTHVEIAIYLEQYLPNLNVRRVGGHKYCEPEAKLQTRSVQI
ncbi:MAG: hypothetical protein QN720_11715 [Nitrososphaeraceae archaeon]|nr:hypothetical protein [Nitrososphaeraceae archaeon]